ncbi:MAG: zinc ABC transporter substrate-binding protein [Verrucomicrobiota bacterium]
MKPIAATLLSLLLAACGKSPHQDARTPDPESKSPLTVAVSIPPQADFVRQIAGDKAQVQVFVDAGQDPHHFSATPRQVMGLAKARAYFTTGMPFEEALLAKIKDSHPDLLVVDTIDPEALKEAADPHAHHDHTEHDHHPHEDEPDKEHAHDAHTDTHDHGHHDEHAEHEDEPDKEHAHDAHTDTHDHSHHDKHAEHEDEPAKEHAHDAHTDTHDHSHHDEHAEHEDHPHEEEPDKNDAHDAHNHDDHHGHHHDFDPHVWLSPPHIIQQADIIHDTLVTLDPDNQSTYDENLAAFTFNVAALHHELQDLLAPHKGKAFFIYHPALTHFAEAYGIEQKSIEVEGKSPTPKQLMALVQEAKDNEVKVIFTQPQIDGSSAQTVADAIDGTVVTIDPLDPDVLTNLESIAQSLASSFNN